VSRGVSYPASSAVMASGLSLTLAPE
jgi:hypothetical protein